MKILLTGASGFIGSRLREALLDAGHELLCVARTPRADAPRCRWLALDLGRDAASRWHAALGGVDAVVNAAGVFRPHGAAGFDAVHTRGPIALFDACAARGVRRVVQLSALGAAADAPSAFLRSKHAADAHLLALPALDAAVVQPSLVFGVEGRSTRSLLVLATLPLLPLPGGGTQPVQPVHVDDVVAAIVALLHAPPQRWHGQRIAAVGPRALAFGDYLATLRAGLGLAPAPRLGVPALLVNGAARVGDFVPGALFDRAAWRMLQQGSQADASVFAALLGRAPRAVERFVAPHAAAALRARAQLGWLLPLQRAALAALWLWTAVVSLGLYPVHDSHALLARAGVPAALQPAALVGAAALDALLGVLSIAPLRRRRVLWAVQAALVAVYTLIITVRLPEYWLHPYGPLTKNLPILALLALLWVLDREPPGPR